MPRDKHSDEAAVKRRIARAEKKALKRTGVEQGIVHSLWELVSMWPKITSPRLEKRVEDFIMNATPEQYLQVARTLSEAARPYVAENPKARETLERFNNRRVGLAVRGEYESTVTIRDGHLVIERGIQGDIPVISVESRRDYADAVLGYRDPTRMITGRKIRATRKLTLLKWALPHVDLLRDRSLFEEFLSYQRDVENMLDEVLAAQGY